MVMKSSSIITCAKSVLLGDIIITHYVDENSKPLSFQKVLVCAMYSSCISEQHLVFIGFIGHICSQIYLSIIAAWEACHTLQ